MKLRRSARSHGCLVLFLLLAVWILNVGEGSFNAFSGAPPALRVRAPVELEDKRGSAAIPSVLLGSRRSTGAPQIRALVGNRTCQVAYIGTAKTAPRSDTTRPLKEQRKKRRWEARRAAKELREVLGNATCTPIFLEDFHDKPDELHQKIDKALDDGSSRGEEQVRLLIVDAGNTYWLWYHAIESGFFHVLAEIESKHTFTYAGFSAGAILAGTTCRIADWKEWDDASVVPADALTKSMDGLRLVDMAVFPHYSEEFKELVQERRASTLPDGQALLCIDDDDLKAFD